MDTPPTSFLGSLRQSLLFREKKLTSKEIITNLQQSNDLCLVIDHASGAAITELTRQEKDQETKNKDAFQKLAGFVVEDCDNDRLTVTKDGQLKTVILTPHQKVEFKSLLEYLVNAWLAGEKEVLAEFPAADDVNLAVRSAFEWIVNKFTAQTALGAARNEGNIDYIVNAHLTKCDEDKLIMIKNERAIFVPLTEPQKATFKWLLPQLIKARLQFNQINKVDPGNPNIKVALEGMPDNAIIFSVEKMVKDGEEKVWLTCANKNKPHEIKLLICLGVPGQYDNVPDESQSVPGLPSIPVPPPHPLQISMVSFCNQAQNIAPGSQIQNSRPVDFSDPGIAPELDLFYNEVEAAKWQACQEVIGYFVWKIENNKLAEMKGPKSWPVLLSDNPEQAYHQKQELLSLLQKLVNGWLENTNINDLLPAPDHPFYSVICYEGSSLVQKLMILNNNAGIQKAAFCTHLSALSFCEPVNEVLLQNASQANVPSSINPHIPQIQADPGLHQLAIAPEPEAGPVKFIPDPTINDESDNLAIEAENKRVVEWLSEGNYHPQKNASENFVLYLVRVRHKTQPEYQGDQMLVLRNLELNFPHATLPTTWKIPSKICLKNFTLSSPATLFYRNGSGTAIASGTLLCPQTVFATGTAYAPFARVMASDGAKGMAGEGGEAMATSGSKLYRLDKSPGTVINALTSDVDIFEESSEEQGYRSQKPLRLES